MTPATYSLVEWLATATALAACVTDVSRRRIPNALTFASALVGVVVHAWLGGAAGAIFAVVGCALGLLLFLPLFALRGLGGGDVKLLAAFGAFIGPRLVIWAGLYGAIAGGVFAVVLTLARGVLGRTLGNVRFILVQWRLAGIAPVDGFTLDNSASVRLPYALPLACGLWVALWLQA
jgi:prepilin peptidase CpaA